MNRTVTLASALCLATGLLATVLLAGCAQKPAATATAKVDNVAVVNGQPISRNTFNFYVKSVARKPAEDLTPIQRGELLDNLIRAEIVAQAAEKDGIAAKDETRAVMDLSRLQVLQQAASQAYLTDRKPSPEELQAEYDLQVGQISKTQYHASHILVPTQALAQKIIDDLGKGASFADLAKRYSTDAGSKSRGGDLDWFSPEGMTPPFAKAVAAMKKGETTKVPVQTEFGFHVIRLIDTRESAPPPLDSVKDRLIQIVEGKKFKAYTDNLVTQAKIEKTLEPAGAAPAVAPPAAAAPPAVQPVAPTAPATTPAAPSATPAPAKAP